MFELERIRRQKLPPASIAIGVLTLLIYGVECVRSQGTSPGGEAVYALGASEHDAIWTRHELWRLLCPAFLHGSLMHIAMNAYSFAFLAPFVERIWGWSRFLVVYVLTAIAGAAASSRFGPHVSVGASGAIFGLMGFLVAAAYAGRHSHEIRAIVRGTWGQGLFISIGLSLFYGFTPGTGIDNLAHLGGLVAGVLVGLVLTETEEEDRASLALGAAAALAIVAAWAGCALDFQRGRRFEDERRAAGLAFARRDYAAAADACDRAILHARDARILRALFALQGEAQLRAGRVEDAYYTLERAWRNEQSASTAALLVEASLRKNDPAAARSWVAQLHELTGGRDTSALLLDPETVAAIASVENVAPVGSR